MIVATVLLFSLLAFAALGAAPSQAKEPTRLVSAEYHKWCVSLLRNTKNETLANFAGREIMFYTDQEMPRVYQDWDRQSVGIGRVGTDPGGTGASNPNVEFPWRETGGIDSSPNANSIKFLLLPDNGSPIVWWQERLPGAEEYYDAYLWEFPVGTVVGEMLLVQDPEKNWHVFEVRTRSKKSPGYNTGWVMNVYRPFRTPAELTARVKELSPRWQQEPQTAALVAHLENAERGEVYNLKDGNHPQQAFNRDALVDFLPPLPQALVAKLLDETPFQSTLGSEWIRNDQFVGFAPNTEAEFHIVPKHNRLAFLETNTKSCVSCHNTTLKQADDFDGPRQWYGRVRGSDHIFSFHIFDPSTIPPQGYTTNIRLRPELVAAGRLVHRNERPQATAQ